MVLFGLWTHTNLQDNKNRSQSQKKTIYKVIKGLPWISVEVNNEHCFFMGIVGIIVG